MSELQSKNPTFMSKCVCVLCGPRETSIYFLMPDLNLYDRQNLFFPPLRDESIKSESEREEQIS